MIVAASNVLWTSTPQQAGHTTLSFLPGEACGACSRKESTKDTRRYNPHRKVVAEPAEVSFAHSTDEIDNHQEGKGQTLGGKD